MVDTLTYSQLHTSALRLATALLSRTLARDASARAPARLVPGDRVLLVFSPDAPLGFAVAFFACLLSGIVPVPCPPVDPAAGAAGAAAGMGALGRVARCCGARVVLADAHCVCSAAALWARHTLLPTSLTSAPLGAIDVWPQLPWVIASRLAPVDRGRGGGGGGASAAVSSHPLFADVRPTDVAFLQFSSGSTGAPRGVVVTHGALAANCALARDSMRVDAACCQLSWLPLWHDMGLVGTLCVALTVPPPRHSPINDRSAPAAADLAPHPVLLLSPRAFLRDPTAWARAVAAHGATHTQGPDFGWALLSSRALGATSTNCLSRAEAFDLSALRCGLSGAERARPSTAVAVAAAFPSLSPGAFCVGYGLAEHTLLVCCTAEADAAMGGGSGGCGSGSESGSGSVAPSQRLPPTLRVDRASLEVRGVAVPCSDQDAASGVLLASVGRVRSRHHHQPSPTPPDVVPHIRIVDPITRAELPMGFVGEVWVRSPSVCAGYHGLPAETESAFNARLASPHGCSDETYLRTGDQGFVSTAAPSVSPRALPGRPLPQLYIVGRIKDVLVVNGRKVAPQDVEATALAAAAAAAATVSRHSGTRGNALVRPGGIAAFQALVTLPNGEERDGAVGLAVELSRAAMSAMIRAAAGGGGGDVPPFDAASAASLRAAIRSAVAAAHGLRLAPLLLLPPHALPKTTSGKLRRCEAARRCCALGPTDPLRLASLFPERSADTAIGEAPAPLPPARPPPPQPLDPARAPALRSRLAAFSRRADRLRCIENLIADQCLASDFLPRRPSPNDDLIVDAGLDSGGCVALHAAIERGFFSFGEEGTSAGGSSELGSKSGPKFPRLPPALVFDVRTVRGLATAVDAVLAPPPQQQRDRSEGCVTAAPGRRGDYYLPDAPTTAAAYPQPLSYSPPPPSFPSSSPLAAASHLSQRAAAACLLLLIVALLATHASLSPSTLCPLRVGTAYRTIAVGSYPFRAVLTMDLAHWRLVEWARTAAPASLLAAAFAGCAREAARRLATSPASPRCIHFAAPSPARLTALLGLTHAAAIHGVWCGPVVCLTLLVWAVSFASSRALFWAPPRFTALACRAAAWTLCLGAIFVANATEPGSAVWRVAAAPTSAAEGFYLRRLQLFLPKGARPFDGLLAGTGFTSNRGTRYAALRLLSFHMESLDAALAWRLRANGAAAAPPRPSLELCLAYVFFAPTFMCGPMIPFAAFCSSPAAAPSWSAPPAAACDAASITMSPVWSRVRSFLRPCAPAAAALATALAVEAATCSALYSPSALFHPSFSHNLPDSFASSIALSSWVVTSFTWLSATWASSAAVFGLARGLAFAHGVPTRAVPHETPLFWTASSSSATRHWATFHGSLFSWFARHVFVPLGGGCSAVFATVAFSTFFHGFHAHWCAWGLGTAALLLAERAASAVASRCGTRKSGVARRVVFGAFNQAVVVTAFLWLGLLGAEHVPVNARAAVAAAVLGGALLRSAATV